MLYIIIFLLVLINLYLLYRVHEYKVLYQDQRRLHHEALGDVVRLEQLLGNQQDD